MNDLLTQLKQANEERCPLYGMGGVRDVSIEFNAIQLAGETGELLNAIKKKLRGDEYDKRDGRLMEEVIAEELADIVICCDLLAQRLNIDLRSEIRHKFNATSEKLGVSILID